ncbi:MAG: hypothetical protein WBK91_04135 [Alphaproteobacteria bacterium]
MGNCLFSHVNWVQRPETSVAASSATVQNPATNLQQSYLRRRHRTLAGVTNYNLAFDFHQARDIGVIALAQPDDAGYLDSAGVAVGAFAATDTVRHRLDLTTAGAGALLDTGAVAGNWAAGYGLHVHVPSSPITARYLNIDINAPSLLTTPAYCDLGLVWAGTMFRPAANFSYGWSHVWQDGSAISRNQRSGLTLVDNAAKFRVLTLGLKSLREAEAKQTFLEFQRVIGLGGLLLCIPEPEDGYSPRQAIIGRLAQVAPITQTDFVQYDATFQIIQNL